VPTIETVLVANRGEIALRVMRTCREMGIRTVAVYSDADADMPFVAAADVAVRLGAPPALESYLDMEKILAAAQGNGADAIHPGYGFLSENPEFATRCGDRGITFIGPPPAAMRAMGDKAEAKRLMERAGVPVLPGYLGAAQDAHTLQRVAARVGFPLLLKAVAGGGGRGIRLVEREADLPAALESAQREAQNAFKDGRVMIEKYLPAPTTSNSRSWPTPMAACCTWRSANAPSSAATRRSWRRRPARCSPQTCGPAWAKPR
jgi:acetyl/propionyl-CoA carboxylase alpha subunit